MFRFTIRDVLWLMVVVAAFALGRLSDRISIEVERQQMREELAAERESLAIEQKMAKIREAEAQAQFAELKQVTERARAWAAANQKASPTDN
jgi:predicted DNA-binding helix-hairpin-helix protein